MGMKAQGEITTNFKFLSEKRIHGRLWFGFGSALTLSASDRSALFDRISNIADTEPLLRLVGQHNNLGF